MDLTWDDVGAFAEKWLVPFGMRLLIALAIFYVGRMVARLIVKTAQRVMDRSEIDVSLRKFLSDIIYAVLLVAVVTAALDTLGIETTAVIAVLGAAGVVDRRLDLAPVADDAGVAQERADLARTVLRHFRRIEPGERASERVALAQDGQP